MAIDSRLRAGLPTIAAVVSPDVDARLDIVVGRQRVTGQVRLHWAANGVAVLLALLVILALAVGFAVLGRPQPTPNTVPTPSPQAPLLRSVPIGALVSPDGAWVFERAGSSGSIVTRSSDSQTVMLLNSREYLPGTFSFVFAADGARAAILHDGRIETWDLLLGERSNSSLALQSLPAGLRLSVWPANASILVGTVGDALTLAIVDMQTGQVSITGLDGLAQTASPDGSAFGLVGGSILRLSSGQPAVISLDGHGRDLGSCGSAPIWSPAGNRIAVSCDHELLVFDADLKLVSSIMAVDPTSTATARLRSWSPDGSTLAYATGVGLPEDADLWVVAVAGGVPVKVGDIPAPIGGSSHDIGYALWPPPSAAQP
jgi:hypothetical protein